jgi:hypothetical protein
MSLISAGSISLDSTFKGAQAGEFHALSFLHYQSLSGLANFELEYSIRYDPVKYTDILKNI